VKPGMLLHLEKDMLDEQAMLNISNVSKNRSMYWTWKCLTGNGLGFTIVPDPGRWLQISARAGAS
jgi:hypothetical protein